MPADALGLAKLPLALERGGIWRPIVPGRGARSAEDVAALERRRMEAMLGERRAGPITAVLAQRGEAA